MVLVLGAFGVGAGVFAGRQAVVEKADAGNDSKPDQKAIVGNDRKPKPNPETPKQPAPKDEPPGVAIAPPPRVAPLNRAPQGFSSAWVRRGGVQTRVIGVRVTSPVLTNDARREFTSPTAVLLIWVETQSLTATGITLRRWLNPLNEFAALTATNGGPIKTAQFSAGARVGGQLEGSHPLSPGGPAIVDVLAFEVPPAAARQLQLKLAASHVGEGEDFVHTIPYEVCRRSERHRHASVAPKCASQTARRSYSTNPCRA